MVGGAWCIRVDLIPSLGFLKWGMLSQPKSEGDVAMEEGQTDERRCSFEDGDGAPSQGMWVASPGWKEQGEEVSPRASEEGAQPTPRFLPAKTHAGILMWTAVRG